MSDVVRCPTCTSSVPNIKAGLAYGQLEPGACPDPWHNQTRNSEVLKSFVAYCEASPDLRFWQALLNWSGGPFVLFSSDPPYLIGPDTVFTDPYNWEGRNS